MIKLNKGTLYGLIAGIVIAILASVLNLASSFNAGYLVGNFSVTGVITGTIIWWMLESKRTAFGYIIGGAVILGFVYGSISAIIK